MKLDGLSANLVTGILQFVIGEAKEIYEWAKQNHGENIPSWDELIAENKVLQDKIEAEK